MIFHSLYGNFFIDRYFFVYIMHICALLKENRIYEAKKDQVGKV